MTGINIINLKCEYEITPLGIQDKNPLLSWQISSENPVMQKAYEIAVASSEELEAYVGFRKGGNIEVLRHRL